MKVLNLMNTNSNEHIDCMPYEVDASGNIIITVGDPNEGSCEVVKLTKMSGI